MLNKFREQVYYDFPRIEELNLFLAVSGGKDSMVLSHLLSKLNLTHTLLHCNFNLRGKESDDDQKFIEEYANSNDIKLEIVHFDTFSYCEKTKFSVQEAARRLRYEWFAQFIIDEDTLILTAHHLDDSIETFFINLLRGTGAKGIKGIPKFNGQFYRPLLNFTQDELFHYIDANTIDYREDSSNKDFKYLRNRIRHSVIPLLSEIDPRFKNKMLPFFEEMNKVDELLNLNAEKFREKVISFNDGKTVADKVILNEANPLEIQFGLANYGIKRSNIKTFCHFLKGQSGSKFSTHSHLFLLDRDCVFIVDSFNQNEEKVYTIESLPDNIELMDERIDFFQEDVSEFNRKNNPLQMDLKKIIFPLTLSSWKQGDKIIPLGMKGSKLISDILIDKKIPQIDKSKYWVISDANGESIGILNLMISDTVKIDDSTVHLLSIKLGL